MMMALTESSSANFFSWGTICLGEKITPSSSTTAILEPKPVNDSSSRPPKLKYTSANTATTNSANNPPPTRNHIQIRERPSAIITAVYTGRINLAGRRYYLTSKFLGSRDILWDIFASVSSNWLIELVDPRPIFLIPPPEVNCMVQRPGNVRLSMVLKSAKRSSSRYCLSSCPADAAGPPPPLAMTWYE